MSLLLVVTHRLWSIIGDSGSVVSSVGPLALALLSFHALTGNLGSRPVAGARDDTPPASHVGPRQTAESLRCCRPAGAPPPAAATARAPKPALARRLSG